MLGKKLNTLKYFCLYLFDLHYIFPFRGGSELGYTWYDQGRLMKKRNSITDLISVIEYLIEARYSDPSLVASIGVSAGGLLLGKYS